MLSEARITQFQILYKKHFGIEINREEALEKGMALSRLVQLTYKPITQEEYEWAQKHQKERKKG